MPPSGMSGPMSLTATIAAAEPCAHARLARPLGSEKAAQRQTQQQPGTRSRPPPSPRAAINS